MNSEKLKEPWEANPDEWADESVKLFEKYAGEIYQANAAHEILRGLEKIVISQEQKKKLLEACDMGMSTNPKECKEWFQFKDFKERLIPKLQVKDKGQ